MRATVLLICMFPLFALCTMAQSPGMLDSTFANGGKLVLCEYHRAVDIATLNDGRFLVLTTRTDTNTPVLVAFHHDGSVDSSFGTMGEIPVPGLSRRVLIDPLGRILVAGKDGIGRYDDQGIEDGAFGDMGVVGSTGIGDIQIKDIAVSLDSRILVIGDWPETGLPHSKMTLIDENGQVDLGFGTNGFITRPGGGCTSSRGLQCAFTQDGNILEAYNSFYQCPPVGYMEMFIRKLDNTGNNTLETLVYATSSWIGHAMQRFYFDENDLYYYWGYYSLTHRSSDGIETSINHAHSGSTPASSTPNGSSIGLMDRDADGALYIPKYEILTGTTFNRWRITKIAFETLAHDPIWNDNGGSYTHFDDFLHSRANVVRVIPDGKLIGGGGVWNASIQSPTCLALARYYISQDPSAHVAVRAFLGGAFDTGTGLMHDQIRNQGLLPLTSPYPTLGFTTIPLIASQEVEPEVFATDGDSAVVDWIWLELLSIDDSTSVQAGRAALLLRNGAVVDMDGHSAVDLQCGPGTYLMRIRHRNHLGATVAMPLTLGSTTTTVDFSDPATPTFGTEAQMELEGIRMLWPGDVNLDQQVKYLGTLNDRDPILSAIGGFNPVATLTGYHSEDVNLDGVVKYTGSANDRDIILQTIGGTVPTAVRVEQTP